MEYAVVDKSKKKKKKDDKQIKVHSYHEAWYWFITAKVEEESVKLQYMLSKIIPWSLSCYFSALTFMIGIMIKCF